MTAPTLRRVMHSSAAFGASVWVTTAFLAQEPMLGLSTYEVLFLLAPLVIMPLSLALLVQAQDKDLSRPLALACVIQPVAALAATASFTFGPGALAGMLTLPWLSVCALLALAGLTSLRQFRSSTASALAARAGMVYVAGGGVALTLSRAGIAPMALQEPIVLLTAVHFHFTGFAAPVLLFSLDRALAGGPLSMSQPTLACSAILLAAATPLLAVGWMLDSAAWKFVCVLMLVTSFCLIAAAALRLVARAVGWLPRVLLTVSAGSVLFGMALAGLYGVGELAGHSLIDLHNMARLHGVANGIGFALCGLLAMNLSPAAVSARDSVLPLTEEMK